MKRTIYSIISFLLLGIVTTFAQEAKIEKSEKLFNGFAYHETIDKLENIDQKTTDMNRRLAESHFKIGQYEQAEQYYATVATASDKTADDVYDYVSVLRINQKYDEAEAQMANFAQMKPEDSRAILFLKDKNYTKDLLNDIGQIELHHLEMNTRQQDFGAIYCKDKIVFTSSGTKNKIIHREWNWNKLPFLDLKITELDENKQFKTAKTLDNTFDKKFHEGPASFNREGTFMAFTQNNYTGESTDHRIKLKIYFASNEIGQWSIGEPFEYNSNEHSVGHPALTADGKTMYFASDMPDGFGGVDIYVSHKNEEGGWTTPQNMGDKVNTEGNEMFPFVHENGLLFYSSNGQPGLGGLDIFVVTVFNDFKTAFPRNIGVPANSSNDDFAFVVNRGQTEGFLSSNRAGGKGNDDIYRFDLKKPFTPDNLVEGIAKTETGELLNNIYIQLYNSKGEVIDSVKTNDEGKFSFIVSEKGNYKIEGQKDKYAKAENSFEVNQPITNVDLILNSWNPASLYCLIKDKVSQNPIDGVKITLRNQKTGKKEVLVTSSSGDVSKELDNKINDWLDFDVTFEKEGYLTKSIAYKQQITEMKQYKLHEELDIGLIDKGIEVGEKLNSLLELKPIYFDLDKADIRSDAATELDKVVRFMNENPSVYIELSSHTDCRASSAYNKRLSNRRAKSSIKYIKERVTNPKQISGKGYGESHLTNKCKDDVECTDEEHQMNRRTEFVVVKM